MAEFNLFGDKLLLESQEEEVVTEKKTVGGLIIPATVVAAGGEQRTKWAEVKKIGTMVENIKEGDIVLYDKYSTADLMIDEVLYVVIKEGDVIASRQ